MNALPCLWQKTHDKIRKDTEMRKFPLYCPKCKREMLINVKNLVATVCKSIIK